MDLPEIALKVFFKLDDALSLCRCECVCQDWRSLLKENVNTVWLPVITGLSPLQGTLPKRQPWENWKDVARLRSGWSRTLPKIAREATDASEVNVHKVPTLIDGVSLAGNALKKNGRSLVTVMDSYSSSRDYIQTQAIGPHVVYAITGISHVGAVDIRISSNTPTQPLRVDPSGRYAPRLQRVCRSRLVPIHEGTGWMSFWEPGDELQCRARFRAIEDEYCQGQLYGNWYACFNPRWTDDESETVDARQTIRLWNLDNPAQPVVAWNAALPSHVVDVALNDSLVACAYGSLLSEDEDAEPGDGLFGLELRSASTGEFVRKVPALTGVEDVIFMIMTRFHCLVVRAADDGELVTIVDLASTNVVYVIDLTESFIYSYGGLHVSDDESMLVLWSSSDRLACVDLLRGAWTLHERTADDLREKWHYGVWVAIENDPGDEQEADPNPEPGNVSRTTRYGVSWKAIGVPVEPRVHQAL